jgi:hypothetical protein
LDCGAEALRHPRALDGTTERRALPDLELDRSAEALRYTKSNY